MAASTRATSPADVNDDGPPQVPYYHSPSGAWEPRAGTEANAGGAPVQSDPRTAPRINDPRFSALPPEDRPEAGPRKELPPQFRRTQVDYSTKEPAGTIVIDTPTPTSIWCSATEALRYGIGVGREGFTWSGAEKISRMAEWPDWNPPEQMIERQPYLPRFMAGGATNPLGASALYLGDLANDVTACSANSDPSVGMRICRYMPHLTIARAIASDIRTLRAIS